MDEKPTTATRLQVGALRNKYFALRHGKSRANKSGIIVSDPKHGVTAYGLNNEGKKEVQRSVQLVKRQGILDHSTVIISSDFLRAKDTAKIAAIELGAVRVILASELRERFFGEWEKMSNQNYQRVWDDDSNDHCHKNKGVESVAEVVERLLSLVGLVEKKYSGRNILFVSHGDTLQILQTLFKGTHPSRHRSLVHLRTGEIREFNLD